MNKLPASVIRRVLSALVVLLAALCGTPGAADAQDAATLRSRQAALSAQLSNNQFQRPLVLESTLTNPILKGDVYAVVGQPYDVVAHALQGMDHWCDILILHLNVKNCRARGSGAGSTLSVAVGRKFDQPLADAYQIDFAYRVTASKPDYLEVSLHADAGPLGTTNYRVVLEAVPLDSKTSFLHMSYSYAYGIVAEVAMKGYLATIGRDKVGFSIVERNADGTPVYVSGLRGAIERNTMRYYLAIEAYLDACTLPAAQQPERRLQQWFSAVERHPRQLHELERDEYVSMKHRELARQEAQSTQAH